MHLTALLPLVRSISIAVGLAVALTPFAGAVRAQISQPFTPSGSVELAPGILFTQGTMRTAGRLPQMVRVATIDPRVPTARIRSLLSNDAVPQRERPSKLALRKSTPNLKAMVAINGGMSVEGRQDAYAAPISLHVSDGEVWVAQACTYPTLGVDPAGGARIADVRLHATMTEVGRKVDKQIHRVNTHRDDAKVVLFTNRFASSTQTAPGGAEVVLALEDVLRPNGQQTVRVTDVRRGEGNTPLAPGMAVLSVGGRTNDWVRKMHVGDRYVLKTTVVRNVNNSCGGVIDAAPGWGDVVETLGGNEWTARDGRVAAPPRTAYPAGSERHPRTGVGVTADGRVLMVTVDGRRPGYSIGVSLKEMGRLMLSLGAQHAFNLDGGGSTVMARRFTSTDKFKVASKPSDGRERLATQALAVYQVIPSA
jgi:uncharacterized protein YigE (DUF2233 family)